MSVVECAGVVCRSRRLHRIPLNGTLHVRLNLQGPVPLLDSGLLAVVGFRRAIVEMRGKVRLRLEVTQIALRLSARRTSSNHPASSASKTGADAPGCDARSRSARICSLRPRVSSARRARGGAARAEDVQEIFAPVFRGAAVLVGVAAGCAGERCGPGRKGVGGNLRGHHTQGLEAAC